MPNSPRVQRQRQGSSCSNVDEEIQYVSYKTGPRKVGVYGQRRAGQGRRSSKFDVPIEGALETRRSWKDGALGSWASTNSAPSSPVSVPSPARNFHIPPSPGRNSLTPRSAVPCTCPDARRYRENRQLRRAELEFSLFDERDLDVVSIDSPVATETQTQENLPTDEEGKHLFCPLIGPVFPVIGKLSLRQVGWSSILKDNTLLAWRLTQFLLALATCIICSTASWKTENFFLVGASSIAVFNTARMASLVFVYRWYSEKRESLAKAHAIYGCDGILYQSALTLLAYTSLALMLSYASPTFTYLIAGTTNFNAGVALIFILTVSSVMDVWVTPIPFRVFYIFPAIIINLIITSLAIGFAGAQVRSGIIVTIVGSVTVAVGYVLHVYSRAIYLWVHRERVLIEQKEIPAVGDEAV